ncbi:MAG TPA: response regulator transcription factor [Anaerolineaceae bacterium]
MNSYNSDQQDGMNIPAVQVNDSLGLDLDQIGETPQRPRVLIVDDEPDTVFLMKTILRQAGFDVSGAYSSRDALQKTVATHPDLILLDLMMPEVDGWAAFEQLRQITEAPVMIVSALSGKEMVVRGLEIGADDYMTKPFSSIEMVARVRNILRRSQRKAEKRIYYFPEVDLKIDLDEHTLSLKGEKIALPGKEFAILELLARQAPNTVSYEAIADSVWGEDSPEVRNRIKYLIFLLRRKLDGVGNGEDGIIVNTGRIGYKLKVS